MPRDRESYATMSAEAEALGQLLRAVLAILPRLPAASTPAERAALGAELAARVDGLRAGLMRRHGLDERRAEAVVAGALARVIELVRATPD